MMFTRLLLAIAVFVGLSAACAAAAEPESAAPLGDDMLVLLDTIRANRRDFVGVNLALPADQAAKFWPIYDRYQTEMNAIGDRLAAIVEDYTEHFSDLSNEKALKLMQDYLAAEADRIKVRQTYLGEFAAVLPGRAVARFYQIENKLDALLRYELAAAIPVIEQGSGATPK